MSELCVEKYASLYAALPCAKVSDHASAFLIVGEDSDGTAALSRIVAARVCSLPDERAFDEHADIAVYPKPPEAKKTAKGKGKTESAKRTVSVDDIREIIDSLYLTPFVLDKKVFIIEDADSMSEICQNKLLKSLEEPPSRVCFILCASGRLLPTVESRCNRIELAPFDISTVERELGKFHKDRSAVALAARASRGNLGLAERILQDAGFADTYATAKKIIATATGSRNFAHVAAVYDKFTREKTDAVLGIMEYLLSDVARLTLGADTVFDERDIKEISSGFTPHSAALACESVREARRRNGANCMPAAVMDNLILKIMEDKVLCQR